MENPKDIWDYIEFNLVKTKTLAVFLKERGYTELEGHSQQVPSQVGDLIQLTKRPRIKVMEIGFNAGHSAEVFLKNNPTLSLTSFDLGAHQYVLPAKEYIDATYPGRHTLYLGDSLETVPKFARENPGTTFDVIFIDGGHDYHIAKGDLENCRKLAHKDTLIIMDDTMRTRDWFGEWNIGPTKAWVGALMSEVLQQANSVDYIPGRGMSWGGYRGL